MCQCIPEALCTKICELSQQKYSSNVIEICLTRGSAQTKANFVRTFADSGRLHMLTSHTFANFVIQTALRQASDTDREYLTNAIYHSLPNVHEKKLRSKWQNILKQDYGGAATSLSINSSNSKNHQQTSDGNQAGILKRG